MKRAILVIAMTAMFITGCGKSSTYAVTTKVVEVDAAKDTVTVETFTGHLFEFYCSEDWQVGDCCTATMNDNGTAEITDDEIIAVRYGGWNINK